MRRKYAGVSGAREPGVMRAAWPETRLRNGKTAAFCTEAVGDRHTHIVVAHLGMPTLADVAEQAANHARMVHRADLAEIGEAADRPQTPRLRAALDRDRRIFGHELEDIKVDRLGRRAEERIIAPGL